MLKKSVLCRLLVMALTAVAMAGCGAGHPVTARSSYRLAATPHAGAPSHKTPPTAVVSSASEPVTEAWVVGAIQRVDVGSPRFDVRDSTGAPMQTLKVVWSAGVGYLGVYHCVRDGRFEVRIATSVDLRRWTLRSVLDVHASQPTLAHAPTGGYVLAVEADNGDGPGPGRRFLRFRYYPDVSALLAGHAARTFAAPHRLTSQRSGAEGTPNIYSIQMRPGITRSRIEVGFHYLTGGVDREARGQLTDFRLWRATPDPAFDEALVAVGMRGKHGDRDAIAATAGVLEVVECQVDDTGRLWRLALYDASRHVARTLNLHTPGGSRSFANPTISYVQLPGGAAGVVITVFVPQTGSARGESGELLYSRRLPSRTAIKPTQSPPPPQGSR